MAKKASDPDIIVQTDDQEVLSSYEARDKWMNETRDKALDNGVVWFRFTRSDDNTVLLFEGWNGRPSDEGAPRFKEK